MKTLVRRLTLGVGVLVVLGLFAIIALGAFSRAPGDERVPGGMRRNESVYVTMRDGVRIAIDIWYPPTLGTGVRVPTLFRATRYVRAVRPALLGRALAAVGRFPLDTADISTLNGAGYVVILVDARGSGASFGTRPVEWSHDEVRDYGELSDWVAQQPWSNGRVGAWGVSYDGNTAEFFATTGSAAVRAVAPLYDDFDPALNLVMPGGVLTSGFMKDWGRLTATMDANDFCRLSGASGLKCSLQRLVMLGTKPVDADRGGAMLDSAVAGHVTNYDVYADVSGLAFPRDTLRTAREPLSAFSPFAHKAELERSGLPMLVRVGWLDAGPVNVALGRFLSVATPQHLEIGPWSHGGGHHVDPFLPDTTTTVPSSAEQFTQLIAFFDGQLQSATPAPVTREIRYYVMNEGTWRSTTQWPPVEMTSARWYFGANRSLTRDSATSPGLDDYIVDTTHTTGSQTRWHTQLGGLDVVYPNRASADAKLLT
ncbi:MAG: CocE/NonD family hydrolase, partial [Gemmatimonadaceae bacterium]